MATRRARRSPAGLWRRPAPLAPCVAHVRHAGDDADADHARVGGEARVVADRAGQCRAAHGGPARRRSRRALAIAACSAAVSATGPGAAVGVDDRDRGPRVGSTSISGAGLRLALVEQLEVARAPGRRRASRPRAGWPRRAARRPRGVVGRMPAATNTSATSCAQVVGAGTMDARAGHEGSLLVGCVIG